MLDFRYFMTDFMWYTKIKDIKELTGHYAFFDMTFWRREHDLDSERIVWCIYV